MSICQYCQVGDYNDRCTCKKEGDICPFMRRCSVNNIWLPLDSMATCRRNIPSERQKEDVELKDGEYIVEYVLNGKLYINIDGALVRMTNPYDYDPIRVKLVQIDGEAYIEEFAPKQDTNKTTNKKSKSKKGE